MSSGTENMQTRVSKFFEKISNDPNCFSYKCLISEKCTKPLSGKKLYNLVGHAKTHTDFYREHFEVDAAVLLDMPAKRLHYIQCCAEFVTVNGEPFTALNKSGFVRLNLEKLQTLRNAGYGDGLGTHNEAIMKHIEYLSSEIIHQIKTEVKGQFVSLMVDTATKYRRSIMGISLQFLRGTSIVIRSIGMIHLESSHSARYIADKIFEQLRIFDVNISQVISITTDNASNMTAMINRCNDMFEENNEDVYADSADAIGNDEQGNGTDTGVNATDTIESGELQPTSDADVTARIRNYLDEIELEEPGYTENTSLTEPNPFAVFEKLLRDLEEMLTSHTLNIHGIRCAAHTLQLAVIGALKVTDFQILIRLSRAVCKELRKQTTIHELNENNIGFKIPSIDCLTRWNSTYTMVNIIIFSFFSSIIYFKNRRFNKS